VYCLVGRDTCTRPVYSGSADAFIADWLSSHPNAVVEVVGDQTIAVPPQFPPQRRGIYIWIADGEDSLAVALVRKGLAAAAEMVDFVELDEERAAHWRQSFEHESEGAASWYERWRSKIPEPNRPHRHITDADYTKTMEEFLGAEAAAKREGLGIWSNKPRQVPDPADLDRASKESFPASDLYYVSGVYAHRKNLPVVYCVLGGPTCTSAFLIPWSLPSGYEFVSQWLEKHPNARVMPVSIQDRSILRNTPSIHFAYVWIADENASLNLALVRAGVYRAGALRDMVDSDAQHRKTLDDPRMAGMRAPMERELAEIPPSQRLISDDDYAEKMLLADAAEQTARREKNGMWRDEELRRWSALTDQEMIDRYREHKKMFQAVAASVQSDSRFALVSQNSDSWKTLLSGGASPERVDAYVSMLKKLGANESLASVYGIGRVSLITNDVVSGLFDSGIIKGYVYQPTDPRPLIKDLDSWPEDLEYEPTAYRALADGWYLFEVRH
jgi:endonuclease YncB( thermonuclease family)